MGASRRLKERVGRSVDCCATEQCHGVCRVGCNRGIVEVKIIEVLQAQAVTQQLGIKGHCFRFTEVVSYLFVFVVFVFLTPG